MKKATLLAFTAFVVMLSTSGCKKGNTGPAGPAGPIGAAGANGNSDIISNPPITITGWNASGTLWYADVTAPGITQKIADEGLVLIYEKYNSSWVALPVTNSNISRYFTFTVGSWTVYWRNIDGTQTTNPGNNTITYRSVYVPPSNRVANPEVDWTNYEQVKKALNLKD